MRTCGRVTKKKKKTNEVKLQIEKKSIALLKKSLRNNSFWVYYEKYAKKKIMFVIDYLSKTNTYIHIKYVPDARIHRRRFLLCLEYTRKVTKNIYKKKTTNLLFSLPVFIKIKK